jgi:protein-S-isoprenylcysteine O-methyltransferase Ste14
MFDGGVTLLRAVVAISSTFGFVTVGLAIAWIDSGRRSFGTVPAAVNLAGVALLGLGLALRAWATWTFWLRGRSTPVPPLVPDHLVTTGPYARSRNPLYLGTVLMSAGMGLLLRSPLLLIVTAVGCVALRRLVVPWEERSLRRRFGEAYHRYAERVPRWC